MKKLKNTYSLDSFKNAFETMSDGIIITDYEAPDNPVIYVNQAFMEITGYEKEDVLGKNCRFLQYDRDQSELEKLRNALKSGQHCSVLLTNLKKDGTIFYNQLSVSPLLDENGKIIHYIGIQKDVTKEHDLEESLKRSEEFSRSVMHNLPAVVYQWVEENGKGRFSFVSEKMRTIFGLSQEDIGRIEEFIHPDDKQNWRNSIEHANKHGKDWYFEGRLNLPNGKTTWWRGISHKIYPGPDRVIYNGLMFDIDHQKKLEISYLEKQASNAEFAKLKSLGEMAAGIAHEINNPLTIIMGTVDILGKKINPETQADLESGLAKVRKMATRISKIIKGLKYLSRSGEMDPFEVFDLRNIIEDTKDIFKSRFQDAEIELRYKIPETSFLVKGRPVQLSQVLLNLLNNSFDAIQNQQSPWIEISLQQTQNRNQLVVTDSGDGISEDVAKKIMTPFFTTKASAKGTGLGLSLSLRIAKDHGGDLKLDRNCPNTRFILEIPACVEESRKAA